MSLFTTGLAELVLIVDDVPRAAKFYREVVGLDPETPADDEWAWFFAGDDAKAQRIALHKGSLLFEEHSPHAPGHRLGNVHWMQATSYYFYDPDGNLLEFWSQDES